MMECFTLWTADQWLMRNSFELCGVFSSLERAIAFAKTEKLLSNLNHVVIDKGSIDNYEPTSKRVFSTEFDTDRNKLEE